MAGRAPQARTCSSSCRQALYRRRHSRSAPDWPWRACVTCSEPFPPSSSPRREFCNDTCRKRAHKMWWRAVANVARAGGSSSDDVAVLAEFDRLRGFHGDRP